MKKLFYVLFLILACSLLGFSQTVMPSRAVGKFLQEDTVHIKKVIWVDSIMSLECPAQGTMYLWYGGVHNIYATFDDCVRHNLDSTTGLAYVDTLWHSTVGGLDSVHYKIQGRFHAFPDVSGASAGKMTNPEIVDTLNSNPSGDTLLVPIYFTDVGTFPNDADLGAEINVFTNSKIGISSVDSSGNAAIVAVQYGATGYAIEGDAFGNNTAGIYGTANGSALAGVLARDNIGTAYAIVATGRDSLGGKVVITDTTRFDYLSAGTARINSLKQLVSTASDTAGLAVKLSGKVDSVTRVAGIDSFRIWKNGVYAGIKDSTGSGGAIDTTHFKQKSDTTNWDGYVPQHRLDDTSSALRTYINNQIAGVNPAVAVQAATTSAGNTSGLTYDNGAGGIGATFTGSVNTAITWDGYTFTAVGQRGLVKDDTQSPSGAFNGVYYVTQIQTAILPPILTRALDYNQPSDINNTGAIPVVNGTVNGTTTWVLTSQVTTVGTDPLTYAEFSYNPSTLITGVTAGIGITGGGSSGDVTVNVDTAKDFVWTGRHRFTDFLSVEDSVDLADVIRFSSYDGNSSPYISATGYISDIPFVATGALWGSQGTIAPPAWLTQVPLIASQPAFVITSSLKNFNTPFLKQMTDTSAFYDTVTTGTGKHMMGVRSPTGTLQWGLDSAGNNTILGAYQINGTSVLSSNTLGSGVLASSLTSTGTLTGGATGAGFTLAFGSSTMTGQVPLANGGTNANLTASNLGIVYSTASALAIATPATLISSALINPSTTTSTTGVMMGLDSSVASGDAHYTEITPTFSGRISINVVGDVDNNTTSDGCKMQIRYGTSPYPANGAALTGTAVGAIPTYTNGSATSSGAVIRVPFALNGLVTGLTVGTTYWIDISLAAVTGGTARVRSIKINAFEF